MHNTERILALYPTSKGFAFLVIEGSQLVVDFGNICSQDSEYLKQRFLSLVEEYYINRVITEKFEATSNRKDKARNFVTECRAMIRSKRVKRSQYSKQQVDRAFAPYGSFTKHKRSQIIVDAFPHLKHILPEKRKIYQSEHGNISIFDCAILVFTHYQLKEEQE